MIIVLLLFFKSICLYCQRLVLHVHDRWINPKNVRLLKEAAESKGSKFKIEEYHQVKKSKKRRYASSSLADSNSCRFCINTPQGYCRHHFHLQELHVQKQQKQEKSWCPLSAVVAGSQRSTEYRQLRKIKRELKRNIQQQQQIQSAKSSAIVYDYPIHTSNGTPPPSISPNTYNSNSDYSSHINNDSGYQTISVNTSAAFESEGYTELLESNSSHNYENVESLPPASSFAESTSSFPICCETPQSSSSPSPSTASLTSFVSCKYSALSTSYL